ncbi:DUF2894 domain-containing protein [Xanthomonas campestris pv. raphani]|uniref:DUF2894 domain-containing protein n=1 Tax=Xanthomonas campestris TaxID=339 RepID=UPI001E2A079D|nr:DUF2894 domain-containing protein [Xanthomonas campestris]MCC8485360.1 DUF2894 domain-containing protein [Xanthomonas campestris]MEA9652245.1 DUF2894 domain-containing protein [Xanthomonas campestris pv. raphani]MEA9745308.1 DUF2894 domain-containing protein [Xanthomonas campestris pv. raphani]MEA9769419.1 DUF2894 domain-containing protein [Xanthomonas campestris pv. raphani]MEA9870512.1 DUF2894 domain-containing protein [Xanthomonas campestris pv. raphani]
MSRTGSSTQAQLEQWRAQGADQRDPVRFHLMQTLQARAATQPPAVRQVLEDKLAALVTAYAQTLQPTPVSVPVPAPAQPAAAPKSRARNKRSAAPAPAPVSARQALSALLTQMAGHTALLSDSSTGNAAHAPQFPELPALDDFRRTWATVRTASQVRQSLQDAPADAGPLNSSVLVHRCISLMRAQAPGYLQHFLAYIDALSWMEQLQHGGALATEAPAPALPGKKRSRSAAPKRRA